ncbi:MAG: transketolase family protein [Planctomycetota bacterium]
MSSQLKTSNAVDIRDAFFDRLYEIAANDSDVVFLTADMGAFSLAKFKKNLGSQYINVGVAEQNLVSVAAGLALGGKKVFIYAIAPFITQRCYEQIKIDLCCMRLPVTVIGVGAGIAYNSDGPTHHATQDIAVMRALEGITIINPSDPVTSAAAASMAYEENHPVYVRIDKGKWPLLYDEIQDFVDGLALLRDGGDVLIVSTGLMVHRAIEVAEELSRHSIDAAVLDLYRIKPVNAELLSDVISQSKQVVTLEEHSIVGGIGSIISEILTDKGAAVPLKRIGILEKICPGYGNRDWMHSFYGLDVDAIAEAILNWCNQPVNETSSGADTYSELTLDDFACLFGTTAEGIGDDCRNLIAEYDFRYKKLSHDEQNAIILRVLKKIHSDELPIAGPDRKPAWEKGWTENLQDFINSGFDLRQLIPKFVKRNEVVRLNGNYVMPANPDFETCFVRVLRTYLFKKYFSDAAAVYEFGCGTGLNLVEVGRLFPEKKLYGLDWTRASCDIISKIAQTKQLNMTGILFNMCEPDYRLELGEDDAAFTIGALEQLGTRFEPFLKFLLEKSPSVCINIETTYELHDQSSLFDYVAAKYLEKRGYLRGYLTRLRQLEEEGKIELLAVRKTFGSPFHDGYSYIVWKPVT